MVIEVTHLLGKEFKSKFNIALKKKKSK